MGCELNLRVIYTEFSGVVRKQREVVKKMIEKHHEEIMQPHEGEILKILWYFEMVAPH
jgi:histone acetyltransferase